MANLKPIEDLFFSEDDFQDVKDMETATLKLEIVILGIQKKVFEELPEYEQQVEEFLGEQIVMLEVRIKQLRTELQARQIILN